MSSQKILGQFALLALFLFAIYSNVRVVIRNHQLFQQVEQVRQEVDRMKAKNEQIALLLSYYETASYQEIEARRRLGLKKPDETVLVVKGVTPRDKSIDEFELTLYQEEPKEAEAPPNNLRRWSEYLFKKR